MPKNKTKFNKNWLTKFRWISEVDDDIYKAYCKLCKRAFKIDVGGVGAVNVHQNTAKHKALSFKEARNESFNQYSTGMRNEIERQRLTIICHFVLKTQSQIIIVLLPLTHRFLL